MRVRLEDDDSVGFFRGPRGAVRILARHEGNVRVDQSVLPDEKPHGSGWGRQCHFKPEAAFPNTLASCDETIDHFVERAT